MSDQLHQYSIELKQELKNILRYWMEVVPDHIYGGFLGKINNDNLSTPNAPKGAVLNARILWSFSSAYNLDPLPEYLENATRAYHYILNHFIDKQFGGVYWTVDAEGNPLDTKKQVYAIAFTIYGLSEYYLASKDEEAGQVAVSLYKDLIKYSYDEVRSGYFEAFTRDWKEIADQRLSLKDENEKKTTNTHLHVLEAFTTLYRIWPDGELKWNIKSLLDNFIVYMINPETGNLTLFFDESWKPKSTVISYGHDIEASWLILEAAKAVQDLHLVEVIEEILVKMAIVSLKGIAADGALWYESDTETEGLINKEKHWWVQAEAMIGFFNAWQVSGDVNFLNTSLASWIFVKEKILDHKNGEWFWGIDESDLLMQNEDKAGLWKCPYHNSRACIEIIRRIGLHQ